MARRIGRHTERVPSAKASLYLAIMKRFVSNGSAPHYAELAVDLGVRPGAARALLHEVTAMALPNWLHPETDLIASFAPFAVSRAWRLVGFSLAKRYGSIHGASTAASPSLFGCGTANCSS